MSATSDTNGWFTHGERLIRAKAKEYFWRDVLQNEKKAAIYERQADKEELSLKKKDQGFSTDGDVQGWL